MKSVLIVVFLTSLFACENEKFGDCSIPATVRDLTGLDGCGFVFELADGSRIEPQRLIRCGTPTAKGINDDPLEGFEFIDGKKVFISYDKTESPSICMVGPVVQITCIKEVQSVEE